MLEHESDRTNRRDAPIALGAATITAPGRGGSVDESADPGKRVLARLDELMTKDSLAPCPIRIAPGAAFDVEALVRESGASSLVLLAGTISLESLCGDWRIPPGYCLLNPEALLSPPASLRPSTGDSGATLLPIPRETLARWLREDPPLHQALNDLVSESYPALRMPESARERIRAARDQNIIALVTREAIGMVNGAGGVLDILNPSRTKLEGPGGEQEGIIEQTWRLVRAVTPIALRYDREEVLALARDARHRAAARGGDEEAVASSATAEMLLSLETEEQMLLERTAPLLSIALELAGYDRNQRSVITDRMLQVRWLDRRLRDVCGESPPGAAIWEDIVSQELADAGRPDKQNYQRILDVLDERLERLFDFGMEKKLPELESIAFRKFSHELDIADPSCEELPASHASRAALRDLEERLSRGETSAVGGSAYAEMRFPKETLEAIGGGTAPVVLFDGDHDTGIRFVRERFGRSKTDPAVLEPCTVTELQGTYGSFARSWIFFRDGTSAVLVSYVGEARQLSNAAAMMLYEAENGGRIGEESMVLAREKRPIRDRLRSDLEAIIATERETIASAPILGERVEHPENLPTQVLIIQHPDQLAEALGGSAELHEVEGGDLGTVHIGYWRSPSGEITRLLVPRVGSSGLYGDTAGEFLKVIWERDLVPNVVPHILFTGTAGGFGDGLLEPGALFTPTTGVTDASGTVRIRSLASDPSASSALDDGGVLRHPLHYSVAAPALETFEMIDELVESGHGSIDVESGPIARAVEEIAETEPNVTFTPIYFFSDNPLEARENPSNTLAYGGPLAEGSKKAPELYETVRELMTVVHARS